MNLEDLSLEELYKLKRQLLMHCVGMSYNMQQVYKINEVIECKQKKLVKESNLKGSEE